MAGFYFATIRPGFESRAFFFGVIDFQKGRVMYTTGNKKTGKSKQLNF